LRGNRALRLTLGVGLIVVGLYMGFRAVVWAWGPILGDSPAIMCTYREVPEGMPLEGSRHGRITLWPMGVECTYWDANGPAVTTQDDWSKTMLALTGATLAVGGVILLARTRLRAQTS